MKIAINCIYFTSKGGGITEYIYNLIREITKINHKHQFILYITKDAENSFKGIINDSSIIKIFPFSENQKIKRSLFQHNYWIKEEQIEKFEIFHSPFFHSPSFKRAKVILTVHDLRFLSFPLSYKIKRLVYLRWVVKRSILKAEHIIAISNFTKNEIIKHYNIESDKINVIYEAVDQVGFSLKNNSNQLIIKKSLIERDKFILSVGHLEPRKNYIKLINAYEKLPSGINKNYSLIIVGKQNHDFKKILETIKKVKNVIYLDFVKRDELIWLYANCKIHVFPSIYEGFGFPSIEAGIFGKPTIGAIQSSIPEIAGDGGVYFNPFSVDNIKNKMISVLSNELYHKELSEKAKINVSRFSWRKNAIETLKTYEIIGEKK